MYAPSRHASNVPFDRIKERHIKIYEFDTGVSRTYRTKKLGSTKPANILKVPVQKWTMRADVILPGDEDLGEGPVQVASVPVPFSMAVSRSIFGQDRCIYVTGRV
ncbi:hypothetical protein SAMD00023353_1401700 [Rosellinia necatrix]|uniref:Uncharacterized protein n=1 Tax=Rosellinia necatrix TaxID=77044 RepID=A0A1W2TD10_ROSNE|nr:hypothetical protein SAMD00023353_1401700 [Rosellinia necatrix]